MRALAAGRDDVRHILPAASHDELALSVSVANPREQLGLLVDGIVLPGRQMDSLGRFWSFRVTGLASATEYNLQLRDGDGPVGEPWPLRTLPDPDSMPASLTLLAFTCAGGSDGFSTPRRQLFKPHLFRQKLFDEAIARKPDVAVAIGDHIYWDLRGGEYPMPGSMSGLIKVFAGWYMSLRYGAFDRTEALIGTANESVLTGIGDDQIANLYGTRFKSVPVFFVADDHDYFENDDADEEIVTFPPDDFSRKAFHAVADLYYPPLLTGPSAAASRSFGLLRYGRLFEAPIFDCAGQLDFDGDGGHLVPPKMEAWIKHRAAHSTAQYFAFLPSHPFGWTAGKWREWYPDVVAPVGYEGVVTNTLMDESVSGELTTKAKKYLWPRGWWEQHQRLLIALAERPGIRFIFSGDIHAQGAAHIEASGEESFERPVLSLLVGPVSSSEGTWPSAARGVAAATPQWLGTSNVAPIGEVNGFAIMVFTPDSASAQLYDCGGYDLKLAEDGRIQQITELEFL